MNLLWYSVHPSSLELKEIKMKIMYQVKDSPSDSEEDSIGERKKSE